MHGRGIRNYGSRDPFLTRCRVNTELAPLYHFCSALGLE